MFNCHSHTENKVNQTIYNVDKEIFNLPLFSIGVHPWNANRYADNFPLLVQKAKEKNCLAIGEIGLDKLNGPDMETQIQVFREQISLSEKMELPVILHCVKAWNEIMKIRKELQPKQPWIFHGFSKVSLLHEVLKEGLMISIGAAVLTSKRLQEIIPLIPNERLLMETDDAPIEISVIYEKISEIKKIPLPKLEEIIADNFKRTFRKWQSG